MLRARDRDHGVVTEHDLERLTMVDSWESRSARTRERLWCSLKTILVQARYREGMHNYPRLLLCVPCCGNRIDPRDLSLAVPWPRRIRNACLDHTKSQRTPPDDKAVEVPCWRLPIATETLRGEKKREKIWFDWISRAINNDRLDLQWRRCMIWGGWSYSGGGDLVTRKFFYNVEYDIT